MTVDDAGMARRQADRARGPADLSRQGVSTEGADPSRGSAQAIVLTPQMIEDLAEAVRFLRLCEGWGHGPGGAKGTRVAGFYYQNSVARKAEAYPAHAMGRLRDLALAIDEQIAPLPSMPPQSEGK